MDPNDTQPGGPSSRTITIHLTRDTLILIAALAFLSIAILLAVFFPPASSGSPTPLSTSIAQADTAAPTSSRQTEIAATPLLSGPAPTGALSIPNNGYPPPSTGATAKPTAASDRATAAIPAEPTFAPPTFDPLRPTQGEVGPAGGVPNQGYPPPGATTTIPTVANPTLQPTTGRQTTTSATQQNVTSIATTPALIENTPTTQPTARPQPTERPTPAETPIPRPTATPRPPPTATPIPIDVLRGNIHWTAAQSPIFIRRDTQLAPGASLLIEPGVEVRLAPGVSFFVDGTLYGLGKPDRPVRFAGIDRQRWEGIFGRPGSNIALEYTEIHGGGGGGTVLSSEGGNLVLHNAHVNDNGGHIAVNQSRLEIRDSEIAGNDMPYGAAIDASYSNGGFVILTNNRVSGNRLTGNAPQVLISNQSPFDIVNLDIQRNLLVGQDGPNLTLSTNGPMQGGVTCNTLRNGGNGLSIRSETPQVPGFALNVRDNLIADHTPAIVPIYTQPYHGIGRGATSEIALDMRNNWWGDPLGPYEPDRHADGRGEAVGDNIEFVPWLTEPPSCAPTL